MKKSLLIDLSPLENPYQGIGQIAINYGNYFKDNYNRQSAAYDLTLLVPRGYFGVFGNEVKYLSSSNWLRRHSRYLFPRFDAWHSIWQSSRFKPYAKSTKYIYTVHDLNCLNSEYEESPGNIVKFRRRISRNITRASVVTAVSNFTKAQVEQHFNVKDKTFLMIYNGVESISGNEQAQPRGAIKTPFFFYISAFREKKNFHSLLDLMKLMPEKHLYLAGNHQTDYGEKIRRRLETENIENVHLLGAVSEKEKTWLYAHCEAFLFPSLFEGFGLPVIEAMQFGKPVFSSKETSLGEIGGKYAYFWGNFEPETMKRLIDQNLNEFYASPERAENEIRHADTFSYKKHFQEYEKIYASI